jgi:hypothetical protein
MHYELMNIVMKASATSVYHDSLSGHAYLSALETK